jgi:DNA-binding response OmpR family regulator
VALARLGECAFDIIVTDLRLPGIDGSVVVEAAVERYPEIIAIVVTGYGTDKDAVDAGKHGAWDFVRKPFLIDELAARLDSALEQRRLKSENAYLRAQLEERTGSAWWERAVRWSRCPAARNRLGDQQHHSHHRRNRHRQGSRGARDSSPQPSARPSLRGTQL